MVLQVNGQIETDMPSMGRALDYGDGLFETMRYEGGGVALGSYHLSRLKLGIDRLLLGQPLAQIEAELQAFIEYLVSAGQARGVIKLRLVRGGTQRGYQPESGATPWRVFEFFEGLPAWGQAEVAILCSQRVGQQSQLAGIKHLNRIEQVVAAMEVAEVSNGKDSNSAITTGIMLDQQNRLCCGVDSNLFVEKDGKILTPTLKLSGVHGVFRRYLMDQSDTEIVEQDMGPDILTECSGLWLSNALRGLRPVISLVGVSSWQYAQTSVLGSLREQLRFSLGVTQA